MAYKREVGGVNPIYIYVCVCINIYIYIYIYIYINTHIWRITT